MISVLIALNMMLSSNVSSMIGENPAVPLFKHDSNQVAVAVAATQKPRCSDCTITSLEQKEYLNKFITAGPVNFKIPEHWTIEEYTNAVELKKDGESIGFVVYGAYDSKVPFEAYVGRHLKKLEKSTMKCKGFHKVYKLEAELAPVPVPNPTAMPAPAVDPSSTAPGNKAESPSYTHYLFIDKDKKNYILISSDGKGPYVETFESIAKGVERNVEYYMGGSTDFGNADIN